MTKKKKHIIPIYENMRPAPSLVISNEAQQQPAHTTDMRALFEIHYAQAVILYNVFMYFGSFKQAQQYTR
jgi:hypothetical protein